MDNDQNMTLPEQRSAWTEIHISTKWKQGSNVNSSCSKPNIKQTIHVCSAR